MDLDSRQVMTSHLQLTERFPHFYTAGLLAHAVYCLSLNYFLMSTFYITSKSLCSNITKLISNTMYCKELEVYCYRYVDLNKQLPKYPQHIVTRLFDLPLLHTL